MVYSEKFFVGFSDVSPELTISNTAILRLFENACCLHGSSVGDGIEHSDGRWFLTAYHVKVLKRPRYEDWVTVKTWSREMKGVSASREFAIYSPDGELCVTALSNWVRMNIRTGRLERMSPEDFARYESEPERHNFDGAWIAKAHDIAESSFEREFYIDRNLIDPNRHMNNVYYLDLALRTIPEEVYLKGDADEFVITYRKAIAYAETVVCLYSEGDRSYTVAVKSQDKSDTRAIIELYK